MILPTKHLSAKKSLFGIGGIIIRELTEGTTVSALWHRVLGLKEVNSFDRFVLALDLLFTIDVIEYEDGLLKKKSND